MSRPLFRDEVLQAQQGSPLGRVQLLRPLSARLVGLALLITALVVLAFLGLASHGRKSTVEGSLVLRGSALQARLIVPQQAAALMRPGQVLVVRLAAAGPPRAAALEGRVLKLEPLPSGGAAAVTMALDPAIVARWPQPLQAGMQLRAEVPLERQRLIVWLAASLSGTPPRP